MSDVERFQQVEREYFRLKGQLAAGRITQEQFEAELQKLMLQDAQGRHWMLGVETGKWYLNDGEKWVQAEPPLASAAPVSPPPPRSGRRISLSFLIVLLLLVCVLGGGALAFVALGQGLLSISLVASSNTATAVPVSPTAVSVVVSTPTPVPNLAPPTSTPTVVPTASPSPSLTPPPTSTPVVIVVTVLVTAPPSPTVSPTASPTPTPTASATPVIIIVVVTATPTDTPMPTDTPTPRPTNTAVPRPPTDTPTPVPPTDTPAPQYSGQLAIPVCFAPCADRNDRRIVLVNLANPDGSDRRVIAQAATDPSFQPDGKRVVFVSIATSQAGRGEGLFIFDLPTGKEIKVDGAPDDFHPIFISGGRVLFSSTRVEEQGKKQNRLFIITKYNSDEAPQSVGPNPLVVLKEASFPSVAPIGLIAYKGCVRGGCGIWTTNEGGYAPNDACCQIARGGSDTAPDWSPDGTRLAFVSREEGNYEIYVVGANGAGRTRLTTSGGTNVAPTWSPDGQLIAYLSDRGGQWGLWVVRPNKPGETTKLFDVGGVIEDAVTRRIDWSVSP